MPVKKFYPVLLLFAFFAFFSCSKDDCSIEQPEQNRNSHAVSIEAAIKDLQGVLDILESKTRAGGQRTIGYRGTVAGDDVRSVRTRAEGGEDEVPIWCIS